MALDERLRRAFEGAGEPADPSGVYEDVIRRRERRRMARRAKISPVHRRRGGVGRWRRDPVQGLRADRVTSRRRRRRHASVQPDPTPVDVPPGGEDIGLGFPVCDVTSVAGVFAPGVDGTAWVATKSGDVGCPSLGEGIQVVAIDLSGDGVADTSFGPLECDPWCSAFAAPDVDGDGTDELLIQNIQFTIAGLRLYDVRSDPEETVAPVTVSSPGYPGRISRRARSLSSGSAGTPSTPKRYGASRTNRRRRVLAASSSRRPRRRCRPTRWTPCGTPPRPGSTFSRTGPSRSSTISTSRSPSHLHRSPSGTLFAERACRHRSAADRSGRQREHELVQHEHAAFGRDQRAVLVEEQTALQERRHLWGSTHDDGTPSRIRKRRNTSSR